MSGTACSYDPIVHRLFDGGQVIVTAGYRLEVSGES